jgi:integrase/recombinase XerC
MSATAIAARLDAFVDYLAGERNLSPATIYSYRRWLERLSEHFGGRDPSAISVAEMRAFLRACGFAPETKNSALSSLKSYLRWGVLEGLWEPSDLMLLPQARVIHSPMPALTRDQGRAFLEACVSVDEVRLVYLGLFAGLRISESASIDPSCWLDDRLRFTGKGRKQRDVPLHPRLAAVAEEILIYQASPSMLGRAMRRLAARTGIAGTSHTLRRTMATMLAEAGVSREVIGGVLGHSPGSVTELYAPVRWSEKVDAIALLDYGEIPRRRPLGWLYDL